MALIHKSYKRAGKSCTRCGGKLPSAHTGKSICRTCLDKGGIDAVCKTCGVTFQTTSQNPNKTTRTCPKCRRANPKDRIAQHEPPPPNGEELSPAARELASRALARKYLWAFVLRHDPKYMVGWFHRDLSARLVKFMHDVEEGKSPRLMIQVPPRHGKSRLASVEFPAYLLGHHPEWEVMVASYAVSLPIEFSRQVRERLRDETYKATFPKTMLHPESQSVESWKTTGGGGYLSLGVGGPATGKGAHCFPRGTPVSTPAGPLPIEALQPHMNVFTLNLKTGKVEIKEVEANHVRHTENQLIEIATASGQRIRTTQDHRFYVPAVGWVEAQHLRPGDPVLLFEGGNSLQYLPDAGDSGAIRSEEIDHSRGENGVLQPPLHGGGATQDLCNVRKTEAGQPIERGQILFDKMCPEARHIAFEDLPPVRADVPTEVPPHATLFAELCERVAFFPDDRAAELALQRWHELRALVQSDATHDSGERSWVRSLQRCQRSTCPSHRPQPGKQSSGEFGGVVLSMPHDSPQIRLDAVSLVARVGGRGEQVYDIQVADTHCFFAGQILVHNCLIIDDFLKNSEEAESLTIRNGIWNWYTSTAYTRLAPGGGIIAIATRWHTDDLLGRLETQMRDEGGEPWEIVRYPAISIEDERFRKANEALHPERYDLESLERIKKAVGPRVWNALYQQNPVPDEGAYFTRSMFRTYEKAPELLDIYNTWDLAVGQKQQNDWSVGVKWGVDPNDNIYILDVLRGRFDAAELVDHMLDMWKSAKTQACGIEEGQIKLTLGPFLEQRVKERRMHSFHHLPLKPGRQDKVARARTLQGRMRQGQVYFPEQASWMDKLMDELLSFPFGKHDDQVDGLAYAAIMAADVTPPQIETSAAVDTSVRWKKRLLGYIGNKQGAKSWLAA